MMVMDDDKQQSSAQIMLIQGNNDVKSQAAKWLFGQEANTVALYLIIAALIAGAWYGLPAVMQQQKEMSKDIAAMQEKARDEDRQYRTDEGDKNRQLVRELFEKHEKAVTDLANRHEKSEDRMINTLDKLQQSMDRIDRNERASK